MYILGIAAFYHDSAACLIQNGEIVAAAQEERFTRKKHDAAFPKNAIKFCLNFANITAGDLENVVFYEKPFLKFERLLETYLSFAPRGFSSFSKAIPVWATEKLFQKRQLLNELSKISNTDIDWQCKLLFAEHHQSHAASAFYPSPHRDAVILTFDGVGEWATTSVGLGEGAKLEMQKEIRFPHSLGLLYSAFTYFTGFKVNSGEYKVMGLAPYGRPIYESKIREELIHIAEDGSFQLNMEYFDFATGLKMTNERFAKLFGGPPRRSESPLTQREMDLAASVQKVVEHVILLVAKSIAYETKQNNLCLAGGVALNCVANGLLSKQKVFENIWIQPAAGDAGGAVGAAFIGWHDFHRAPRRIASAPDLMKGAYLGPAFDDTAVIEALKLCGAKFHVLSETEVIKETVLAIKQGKAVGWMQGRMEFGPRALGCRSILADPRSAKTQKQLNLKVKFRESFRPFAPSILKEHLSDWFDSDHESPYMLVVADLKENRRVSMSDEEKGLFGIDKLNIKRSEVPAITHVDYSARIQTVDENTNPKYHKLLTEFHAQTGCPILVNTSFNVRGEPVVCTPTDAFKCFMGTGVELLVIGNLVLHKNEQPPELIENYENTYELD